MLMILLVVMSGLAVFMFGFLFRLVASEIIIKHNIKKYGCWWGKMPKWLEKFVDFL